MLARSAPASAAGALRTNLSRVYAPARALGAAACALRSLGYYTSAAEAGLAYARHLGPAGCAAALAPSAPPKPPMTEAEARLAAAEGVQLVILDAVPVSGVKRARVL